MACLLVLPALLATPAAAAEAGEEQAVRGLLRAKARSDLSVQITAPVAAILKREGEPFRRMEVLLKFDCSLLKAEWAAAKAAWRARNLKARSKRRLLAYQAAGRLDAAVAMAEAEQAAAEAKQARLRVQQCNVRAPYDGWVVARHVDIQETPRVGGKLITIVRRGPLEVEMIVPAAWLKWLKVSEPFEFRVDGLGEVLKGKVTRIGAEVDQVSQTVRVYGEVGTPPSMVRPGMTGQVRFIRRKNAAFGRKSEDGKGGGA